jgi:hypothetical protein
MAARVKVLHADGSTEMDTTLNGGITALGFRRFILDRTEDVSGVSGTGTVAEGCQFTDGRAVIRWCVGLRSTAIYDSVDELLQIHGHSGATRVVWVDRDDGR